MPVKLFKVVPSGGSGTSWKLVNSKYSHQAASCASPTGEPQDEDGAKRLTGPQSSVWSIYDPVNERRAQSLPVTAASWVSDGGRRGKPQWWSEEKPWKQIVYVFKDVVTIRTQLGTHWSDFLSPENQYWSVWIPALIRYPLFFNKRMRLRARSWHFSRF